MSDKSLHGNDSKNNVFKASISDFLQSGGTLLTRFDTILIFSFEEQRRNCFGIELQSYFLNTLKITLLIKYIILI